MKKILFFLSAIFAIAGCKEEIVDPPPDAGTTGVYVVNEGAFAQNNASITYYNPQTNNISHNVYSLANNNNPLGDNANNMFVIGNKGFIAVDNSNKIEIINLNNFVSEGFVDLGANGSPREIWMKDTITGYVTSLNSNEVIKFNASTKTIEKRISIGEKPEGLIEAGGKLFAANSGFGNSNTISIIDLNSDAVLQTLTVGFNPRILLEGPDGNVYAVCSGSYTDTTVYSGIYKIDPSSNTVIDSIRVNKNPGEAVFIGSNKLLVSNSDGVKFLDLSQSNPPDSLFVSGFVVNSLFGVVYSLGYDQSSATVYCGNPKDFTQNGEVAAFDLNGNEKFRFNTGINPGTIVIR